MRAGRTTLRRIVATLAFIALNASVPSALGKDASVRWLSVDMPHGGCSLTVHQDGSATIHFGAMPRWVHVAPLTFSLDQLIKWLRAKSYPQRAPLGSGRRFGSLSLYGTPDLLFIDDHELVRALLERAWRARVRPTTPREVEDYAWASEACTLL